MELDVAASFRRKRLQDFVNLKFDENKAALGRALGYRDGAFVGQMIRGKRPITEKTIAQINELPGGNGWFDNLYTKQEFVVDISNYHSTASAHRVQAISLDDTLKSLARHLDAAGHPDAVAGLLVSLVKSPNDPVILSALKTMLEAFAQAGEKQA